MLFLVKSVQSLLVLLKRFRKETHEQVTPHCSSDERWELEVVCAYLVQVSLQVTQVMLSCDIRHSCPNRRPFFLN